jgi:predicted metal-binding membrane protein
VTTVSAAALRWPALPAALLASLKRLTWRSPESWSLALSALAWVWLAARAASAADPAFGAHAVHQPSGSADAGAATLAVRLADWSLMVVAMMVPLVAASVRMVAARSLWRRRHRAAITFLSSYVLVWSVVGWATLAAVTPWLGSVASPVAVTAALLFAAAWQTTSAKQRALMACHRTAPLAPNGWRATRDCAHYGLVAGLRCAASCWAMMLACALAHHSLLLMAVASVVGWVERSTRWGQRTTSAALGACALLHAVITSGVF